MERPMTKPQSRDAIYLKRQFDFRDYCIVRQVVHHLQIILSGSGRDDGRAWRWNESTVECEHGLHVAVAIVFANDGVGLGSSPSADRH
jgi:hypothetical protein